MGGRPRNSTPSPSGARPKSPIATNATPARAAVIASKLAERWPDVRVELDHQDAYQLLVATILAAQSTDKLINTVTPALFDKYPDPGALAQANQAELEPMIFKTGFFRMKAKHLIGLAQSIVREHGGQVPDTIEALCALPGVARKTANVVLGNALGKHVGIVVDTHVTRVSARLGLTTNTDPVKIEQDLMALIPQAGWTRFGNQMIHHGRYICLAKAPDCEHCPLAPVCPSSLVGHAPLRGVDKPQVKPVPLAGARTPASRVAKPRPRS
ncbi:MAG: endonuclease [Deltaproteobacteria bacterium]|nr:endonuclease [Deltaproteobacteria bacterium]